MTNLLTVFKTRAVGYRRDFRMDVAATDEAEAVKKMKNWMTETHPDSAARCEYRAKAAQKDGLPISVIV